MDFHERMNSRIDVIDPRIEKAYTDSFGCGLWYISVVIKDRTGLVEEVYGVKTVAKKIRIQKLACIPFNEKYKALTRNCYVGYGCNAGFHSYGYTGKGTSYRNYEDSLSESCIDNDYIPRYCIETEETLAKLDPRLAHCGYHGGVHVATYIPLLMKYPLAEAMYKNGLYRLINEKALSAITEDRKLFQYIMRNLDEVKGMAFQTIRNAYKRNRDSSPKDYANSLYYRCEAGREVALRDKELYSRILKHTSRERIQKYLNENKVRKDNWEDYIVSCDWLRLDLSDTKVLFPKNFMEMHDLYTEQYFRHKAELERIRQAERDRQRAEREKERAEMLATVSPRMLETAERFSFLAFASDGYMTIVARTKEDLINEGAALNHCVGRMRYDERQADGKSVICFIRKSDEPDKPYVTAEVKVTEQTLKVVQCYGYHDSVVHDVDPFVDEWMKNSNGIYRNVA